MKYSDVQEAIKKRLMADAGAAAGASAGGAIGSSGDGGSADGSAGDSTTTSADTAPSADPGLYRGGAFYVGYSAYSKKGKKKKKKAKVGTTKDGIYEEFKPQTKGWYSHLDIAKWAGKTLGPKFEDWFIYTMEFQSDDDMMDEFMVNLIKSHDIRKMNYYLEKQGPLLPFQAVDLRMGKDGQEWLIEPVKRTTH